MSFLTRDDFLSMGSFIKLALPSGGSVSMHPYVSGLAMDTYIQMAKNIDTSEKAFRAMVSVSLETRPDSPLPLSDADSEVIARLYAKNLDFADVYEKHRKAHSVYEAFYLGFATSEFGRRWKRDQERIVADLSLYTRILPKPPDQLFSDMQRFLKSAETVRAFENTVPDMSRWVGARSVDIQVSSAHLLPKILALEQLSSSSLNNFNQWNRLAAELNWSAKFGDRFKSHAALLNGLTESTKKASRILEAHSGLVSGYTKFAELFRTSSTLDQTLRQAANLLEGSNSLVAQASKFLIRERPLARPVFNPPNDDPRAISAKDAGKAIEADADEADDVVHSAAGQVLLLGNDGIVLIRELLGAVIDDRLKPYVPIMERMQLLSQPGNFIDVLAKFATTFARDHWKDLWIVAGDQFRPSPEGIGRLALSMFLHGQFNGAAFVGKELNNGDGFVDMLVNFLGMDFVVEVKIVGANYGIGRAKAGLKQLGEYISNYSSPVGHLLVFDGRKSTDGEQLDPEYKLESGAIVRVTVVRSYFDAPSRTA